MTKTTLKKVLKRISFFIGSIILLALVYLLFAFVLSRVPVNSKTQQKADVIEVFIITNGTHTDLVLPVINEEKDWRQFVKYEDTKGKDSTFKYLAFGWGDKGFYLEIPTWADLTPRIAFRAAFGLGTTAMHTTFYKSMTESETCKSMFVSKEEYKALVKYISDSFQKTTDEKPIFIQTDAVYGNDDVFYEAIGSYSLIHTCNTWANNGLKAAQQKASLWTPFDTGIFFHYK